MTKKTFWKNLSAKEKRVVATSLGTSVDYLRQVFIYGKTTGPKRARELSAQTGGAIGAHEFCPDAYSEADSLSIGNQCVNA